MYEQNFKVKTIKTKLVKMGQPEVVRRKRVINAHQAEMAYKRREQKASVLQMGEYPNKNREKRELTASSVSRAKILRLCPS